MLEPRLLMASEPIGGSVGYAGAWAAGAATVDPDSPSRLLVVDAPLASFAEVAAWDGQVVVLDLSRDGLDQIGSILRDYGNVSELHILSHGGAGVLQLGQTMVTAQELHSRGDAVEAWRSNLAQDATIFLYGCSVAEGQDGRELVDLLAALTGATVAASTDATGAEALGGNLVFEYVTGQARYDLPFSTLAFESLGQTLGLTVSVSSGESVHMAGGAATVVDPLLQVTGSGTSIKALVYIQSGLVSEEDRLSLSAAPGVNSSYDEATGVLTLTSASARNAAQWQSVLATVTYSNTQTPQATLADRDVRFRLEGGSESNSKIVTVDRAISAAVGQRVQDAFDVIAALGQKIAESDETPGKDDTTEVPLTSYTVTDLLYPMKDELDSDGKPQPDYSKSIQPTAIGGFLQISTAVKSYFTAHAADATVRGLRQAVLAELATIVPGDSPVLRLSAVYDPAVASPRLDLGLVIATTRGFSSPLALGDIERELNLRLPESPTITVGGGADIKINIGLKLGDASIPSTAVTLDFERLNALAGFTFGGLNTTAEVGVIRGRLVDASGVAGVTIPVKLSSGNSQSLNLWGTEGNEFEGFDSLSGAVHIELPISASIGGVLATTGATKIVITDDDIFDNSPPLYSGTDFNKLAYFASLNVEAIIQEVLRVGNLYSTLSRSGGDLFGVDVPFVLNTRLGDLFDFKAVFDEFIASNVDVFQPVLNTIGRDVLLDYRLPISSDSEPVAAMWSDLRAGFEFGVVLNNTWPVKTVTVAAKGTRASLDELVADLNTSLAAAGVGVEASNVQGKIFFTAADVSIQRFAIVPSQAPAARLNPSSSVPSNLGTLQLNTAYYYTVTGTTSGTVKGTNYYSLDSSIAAAAVHAGVLKSGETGVVKVTRVGSVDAWASTRNGVSSSAFNGQVFLIESGASDLKRLGIAPFEQPLGLLESITQGKLTASIPLPTVATGSAQFKVQLGGTAYDVTVSGGIADRAGKLSALRAALQGAGISATALDARLVQRNGNPVSGALDASTDYFVQFYLPQGSDLSTFSVSPVSEPLADRVLPLGFLVGEVASRVRPAKLRTFEDFQDPSLIANLSVTPIYDDASDTVTLQFKAIKSFDSLLRQAGFRLGIRPFDSLRASNSDLQFSASPTVELAFGIRFKIGPTAPVVISAPNAAPTNGRLSQDATFTVDMVLQDRFDVTVPQSWTAANQDIQDLIGDINRALKQAARQLDSAAVDLTTDRLIARRAADGSRLELLTAQPTNGGQGISITHTGGVVAGDLLVPFTHNGVAYLLNLPSSRTTTNGGLADLLLDLNAALSDSAIDANGNGAIDANESIVSLAATVFFTTIADASGSSTNQVHLFATSPSGTSWPTAINIFAENQDAAATQLGFNDGSGSDLSKVSGKASGSSATLTNHTDGSPFAAGELDMPLPSFAGSVKYGFNTIQFGSVTDSRISSRVSVKMLDGVEATTTAVSTEPSSYFVRSATGAGGSGNSHATLRLNGLSSDSATIDRSAHVLITVPDLTAMLVQVEQPIGLPIPVIQANSNGTLSGNATVNFLYEGAKYSVTVTAAQAAGNTSFAQLAAQFHNALSSATVTVGGVAAAADASELFTIRESDGQLRVNAFVFRANPNYAQATPQPGLSAFGEVGLQGAFGLGTVVQSMLDSMALFDHLQLNFEAFTSFPLPLVNKPLNELIDIRGDLLSRIDSLSKMTVNSPAQLASAIAAALSCPATR